MALAPLPSPPRPGLTGSYGFLAKQLEPGELDAAGRRARHCGLSLHAMLIGEGRIQAHVYASALGRDLGLPLVPSPAALGFAVGFGRDGQPSAWAAGHIGKDQWIALSCTIATPRAIATIARRLQAKGWRVGLTTDEALRACVLAKHRGAILRQAVSGLARVDPAQSARAGSWLWQAVGLAAAAGLFIGLTVIAGVSATWLQTMLLSLPFLAVVCLRAVVVLAYPWARPRPAALKAPPDDRHLPVYTLLVPLFHEAPVLPQLIEALRAIDYPAGKLDIKLILESVDTHTLAAVRRLRLRPPFDIIVVPDALPRCKPKALNYALTFARGEFVCVFDAEDVPDPDQLRRAVAAFADGPPELGCVQGRLVIDNEQAGWLCQQFALEYLILFEGLLPALDRMGLPLPLGGTSNHFPMRVLREVGNWDAWNVTEDADLGFRLARRGYTCRLIATDTYEEAPHRIANWLRQRTRWQKGWLQTYTVHNRQPMRLFGELGLWKWLGFQAQFGGVIVSSLIYPVSLALLLWQLVAGPAFFDLGSEAGQFLNTIAAFNLLAGLSIALLHAAVCAIGQRRWRLLWAVPWMPIYWLLISIAAYRAIWQLAWQPFRWEKTEHGLSKRSRHRR